MTKMSDSKPLEPEVIIAKTEKDVISASGSKYCPVPLNSRIKDIITEKGKFAIVGLPCQIHGVRKYELINKELKNKILFHFGLFSQAVLLS